MTCPLMLKMDVWCVAGVFAFCCSVLQCFVGVLQFVPKHTSIKCTLWGKMTCPLIRRMDAWYVVGVLQVCCGCVAGVLKVCCRGAVVYCSVLQRVAACCSVLQRIPKCTGMKIHFGWHIDLHPDEQNGYLVCCNCVAGVLQMCCSVRLHENTLWRAR